MTLKNKILEELDALIQQADGKGHEGCSIRKDPALSRDLEWIKEFVEAALDFIKFVKNVHTNEDPLFYGAQEFLKEYAPELL